MESDCINSSIPGLSYFRIVHCIQYVEHAAFTVKTASVANPFCQIKADAILWSGWLHNPIISFKRSFVACGIVRFLFRHVVAVGSFFSGILIMTKVYWTIHPTQLEMHRSCGNDTLQSHFWLFYDTTFLGHSWVGWRMIDQHPRAKMNIL